MSPLVRTYFYLSSLPYLVPRPVKILLLLLIVLFLWLLFSAPAPAASHSQSLNNTHSPILGVNFINSVDHPADGQMLANGVSTGANWNRWPLYWPRIETNPGQFDWASHDAVVHTDITTGFNVNAILLGTPWFYTTDPAPTLDPLNRSPFGLSAMSPLPTPYSPLAPSAAAPAGLYDPIFTDGTDQPGQGKQINPNNKWAFFVYAIVQRYKPGGVLAQTNGWPTGRGITHWEMWNEPDFSIFWDSSLADYARLLKVGYITAKQADPQAQVLFGGLANNGNPNFYAEVLTIFANDPLAHSQNFYHDIFATHSYSYAWKSWYTVWKAGRDQEAHGFSKPIWLNETGVPAWNDYPGPVWDPRSGLRATTDEQADFALQTAFFATYAGADALFHFQLYDGCGNQPAGTNFPPHNGELCDANGNLITDPTKPCAGDANGLFRNPSDAICFAQHPQPESPRPVFTAFRLLSQYFQGVQPLWRLRPGGSDPANGPQEWIAFYQPHTGKRIIGMWARFGTDQTAVVEATAQTATLLYPDGATQALTPVNGQYHIHLPAATNQNAFWDPSLYMIGGRTRILIESYNPNSVDSEPPVVTASATINISLTEISLVWSATDDVSGVKDYNVTVSVDHQPATPLLTNTTQTSLVYPSAAGHVYRFTITAQDYSGRVSSPRPVVVITKELPLRFFFPLIRD